MSNIDVKLINKIKKYDIDLLNIDIKSIELIDDYNDILSIFINVLFKSVVKISNDNLIIDSLLNNTISLNYSDGSIYDYIILFKDIGYNSINNLYDVTNEYLQYKLTNFFKYLIFLINICIENEDYNTLLGQLYIIIREIETYLKV